MTLPKDPAKREEYLRKMSERGKARFANPEVRKAESERAKAQWSSPEARKQQSERTKAQFADPEARAKMSTIVKKRYENPEYRQMMQEKSAEAMRRPEVRAKMSAIKKAEMNSPARRQWLSEKALKEMSDPARREISRQAAIKQNAQLESRERHSAFMKEYYARPEAEVLKRQARESLEQLRQQPDYWESVARGMATSKKYSRTNIERIVESVLQTLAVEYEAQKHIGRWVVDFFIPSMALCLECDGDYWHSLPSAQERDARKDASLQQKGYTVLRLLGSQILTGELDNLINLLT
jgi:very-short-patch-repair endonuclease